ncbi:alpha/beta hydrolase [Kribbella sp. ALI-6-A]|uniref:alpha/beta fold hydrolase n=1 Tax=Kribbella sp. ALI-6-A TaxID=1933817 RepID=UPI00097CA61D|nr:alpha/beta hydrolase [Kribbella sp. ALI-6-A]ONI67644.1 alpha/beta hydrolase [Kribbella sp. ALI-6-A]
MTASVVLVPGLGLGPEAYGPTRKHLEIPSEVVTLPGFGEPTSPGDDLRVQALADRLATQLKEPSVLVGHSASCHVVVEVAVSRPDLVSGLVLLGPTGDIEASGWPTLAGRWVRSAVWERPYLIPTLTKQYFRTTFRAMARAEAVVRHYDLAAAMPHVGVPTVVLRCPHDSLCPSQWAQRVADLAGGEAWTLPSGSHMPVLTNGRDLAAFIHRAAGVYKAR